MSDSVLIAHRGSQVATVEQVAAAPVPVGTKSWFPVPHIKVLEAVRTVLGDAGFKIQREQLALSGDGQRFFGTLDLASGLAEGVTLSAGVRNSNDQRFTLGFSGGARVFVCDNLSFSGDLVVSRKHTRFGNDRYLEAISLAVQRLGEFQTAEHARIQRLVESELRPEKADSIILNAYTSGVVSHLQLPTIIKEWRTPRFQEFQPRTQWSLWNAFTFALAGVHQKSPQQFASKTIALQGLFDRQHELPAAQQVIDATPELSLSV